MPLSVEIDRNSGFCGGVIRAIGKAEDFLGCESNAELYSLGDIVHNEAELSRLRQKGLVCIRREDIDSFKSKPGRKTLLIRAHGEPPSTYREAQSSGFEIIDCTCPVVLKLQESIREAYQRVRPLGGKVLIFGKIGHAEVLGLVGQTEGDALVVENLEMLEEFHRSGELKMDGPVELFSQTTKSPDEYSAICSYMENNIADKNNLVVHNTICSQVASRHSKLAEFARCHDAVVFVAGKQSSNGKVLCDLCRSVNERTYVIGDVSEIDSSWFKENDFVGVCGATSTPKWLLDQVSESLQNLSI